MQLWSFAGDNDRQDVSQLLIQPFVNDNMDDGWYLRATFMVAPAVIPRAPRAELKAEGRLHLEAPVPG